MTYPPGQTERRHGWPPQQPYPPLAATPGGHETVDLRERLARLETSQHHTGDWLRHIAAQVQAQDERIRKIGSRLGQAADTVTLHIATLKKLEGLPSAIERAEAERKFRLDVLRYAAAGAIVIAVALAKGEISAVLDIVKVVLGAKTGGS